MRSCSPGLTPGRAKENAPTSLLLRGPNEACRGQFRTPPGLLLVLLTLALLAAAWLLDDREARTIAATASVLASFLLLPRCGRALGYRLAAAVLVIACCTASMVTLGMVILVEPESGIVTRVAVGAGLGILAVAILAKGWLPLTGLRAVCSSTAGVPPAKGSTRSGALPGAPSLRVASWNVFLRVVAADRLLENDAKEARVEQIARKVTSTGADVVCLQECNATFNFRVHRLLERLRETGGYAYCAVPQRPRLLSPFAWIDSGLVTASRLPIERTVAKELPRGSSVDQLMAKGAQASVIAAGGESVNAPWTVVNAHLQADYALPENGSVRRTTRYRVRQLRALRTFVDRQRQRGAAPGRLVVCGDMNGDRRRGLRLERGSTAERLGMHDPWQERPPTSFECWYDREGREVGGSLRSLGARWATSPPPGIRCIARSTDYILVEPPTKARAARVLDGPPLSDHNLLVADVGAVGTPSLPLRGSGPLRGPRSASLQTQARMSSPVRQRR
jgi:endonuclease/exonuclease/phosphatase family metal-dependent hydrolase